MQVLKHLKSGRYFVATPALLKHKNMQVASPEESAEFLEKFGAEQKKKLEESKSTQDASLMLPKELDVSVDIKNWGKPQLLQLANKINLSVPTSLKVKDLRLHLQDALNQLAEKEMAEKSTEVTESSETPSTEGE